MKRILSALLSIAMLLALSVTASAAEFPDVPAGSTYAQAVQWVSQQGYINGYNDGRFGVNDNVTRAQLSAILYRAAGSPAASGTTRFPDVAATAYYAGAASWAADGGLINGYSDGRFGVNDPITRQQVTAIFWRWAGSPAASAEDYADEASISNYAKTAVDWARANSIVPAKDGNRFAPTDNATRGEIALILYNYMNRNSQPVTPSAGNGAKVLVAYFSATGSTQAVANTIASTLNADTFEITPANPYSSADLNWTDSSSRVNDEHDNVSKRNIALVKDSPDNWADYDVVFIGYPIWWGIAAWPVDTFVKANDFTGKTVIPFCTSSSSGLGQSGQLLEEMATGGSWQEGQRFSSGASAGTVTAWVNGLNLPASSAPAVAETAQPSREEGRALVVYFSQPETTNPNNMTTEEDNSTVVINGEVLGNTQYMAQVIQKTANADIFRIEPATPYPTDHTTLVAQAREEQDRDFRPALAKNIDNLSGYDTVFVGYPNWWGDMPMVMYTFFETHDFAGKTIIPFNTHKEITMKKKFRFLSFILTLVMCTTLCVPAFAVAPDRGEDAVVVYSESQLQAEIERGTKEIIIPLHNNVKVQETQTPDNTFQYTPKSSYDYKYECEIIGTGTSSKTKEVTSYVTNNHYPSESTWPEVTHSKGETTTIKASLDLEVDIPIKVLQLQVTGKAGVDHTVQTIETITYKIPYGYKGCIYYAACFEYFQFKTTQKDLKGNVVSTTYNGCTGDIISSRSGYNVRLIKL